MNPIASICSSVLPHLPPLSKAGIKGALFTGRKDSTSKRIAEFLTDIGVMCEDGRDLFPLTASDIGRRQGCGKPRSVPNCAMQSADGQTARSRTADGITASGRSRPCGRQSTTAAGCEAHGKGYTIKALPKAIDKIGGP
jgi:hypothetical protein